jgi:hypothetical protein
VGGYLSKVKGERSLRDKGGGEVSNFLRGSSLGITGEERRATDVSKLEEEHAISDDTNEESVSVRRAKRRYNSQNLHNTLETDTSSL